ncbi:MAG: HypC/HybG/HupF family hydrogenase formation chaperone [Gammaproteobacteria bacterium]|nr:HypC/HybG/HupF family hydrogenase formation chaperone [Gammaproteobacteria bacterium]MBT8150210.1 HypC/HybG/HupF family hydrogenase formation chaperone [Gammaproteobacteria bacterium]NNM10290.1 HypC/HybG/HupF family hydrogenase formation chaperone [Pseudomonadales bacterium]
MCLALPGKLIEITHGTEGSATGIVNYGGLKKSVDLSFVPEALINQYVLVHAGFAISVLDKDEAQASLDAFRELDEQNNTQ